MAEKALVDITSEQTASAATDLMFIEKAGTPAKINVGDMLGTNLVDVKDNATTAGLAVVTAADAAAQRTALGAQEQSATLDTLSTTATTAGTDLAAAATAAAQRTLLDVYTKAEVDAQSLGSKDWDTGGQVTVADNTAIQNTTGGPIGVMLEVIGDSDVSFEIKVGTSTGTVVAGGYTANFGVPVPTFFLVPDQDYWRVNETVGTINLARAVIFQ